MKIIRDRGLLTIDKQEIDALIAAKKFIGLNRSPRAEKVIVSLTSYKPRIRDVKYVIFSLLNQTFPPDKLILWLDEDSFPQREKNLPRDLLKLRAFGLTIAWCENIRSYKKLIPALEKYPDDIIVTADDDIFYLPDWLKILYDEHKKYPDCVVAHRCHRVRLDAQERLLSYNSWYHSVKSLNNPPPQRYGNFFTSGAGALYKKIFFHGDILRRDLFKKLAPNADDIWFWAMTVLNGTKTRIPAAALNNLIYIDIDMQRNGETLYSINKTQNDVQLRQVTEHYPALLDILIREAVDGKPYISVVAPIKNPADMQVCLKNIFEQKFPDLELIIINLGARMNLPPMPTNFRVINYPNGSLVDALNLGLRNAAGDYIFFKDENSILPNDALNIAAQIAADSKADVIHFSSRVRIGNDKNDLVIDDAPELRRDKPLFLDMSTQQRAALWLQNKLSRRLDTKIFRRDFLTERGLTFGGNLSEFMFQALAAAKRYLLIPQAFNFFKQATER